MTHQSHTTLFRLSRYGIIIVLCVGLFIAPPVKPIQAQVGGATGDWYYYEDQPAILFEDMAGASSFTLSDGGVSPAISFNFIFNFYGKEYSSAYICANGVLQFQNAPTCSWLAYAIPSTGPAQKGNPDPFIAAWWGDLDPSMGGTIQAKTVGAAPNRIFVVEFNNIHHFERPDETPTTFQIKLFETTNEIEIHYQDAPASTASTTGSTTPIPHTVGIEKNGTFGLQYYYGNATLASSTNPLKVRFFAGNPLQTFLPNISK